MTCRSAWWAGPRSEPDAGRSCAPSTSAAPSRGCSRWRNAGCRRRPSSGSSTGSPRGLDVPEPVASEALLDALAEGDPDALAAAVSNDLQPAALSLFPELADTLAAGSAAGALAGLVSGSGPTTAFLARDPGSAAKIADALRASGTCRSVRTASGPVPGATVMGA
ncbi:hypothetical protein RKD20_005150 [Streptomyces sp. SLBN-8D4]